MVRLERILYVEDDLDIQSIARLALVDLGGFKLEICSSGPEALARAPDFAPQLALVDMMMPEMDGLTTMAELRKLPGMATLPVVFMTAKVQGSEVQHYRSAGAVDVFSKPFDPMTLAQNLRAVWDRLNG
jgi:two-component system, OmpR family, response regulator